MRADAGRRILASIFDVTVLVLCSVLWASLVLSVSQMTWGQYLSSMMSLAEDGGSLYQDHRSLFTLVNLSNLIYIGSSFCCILYFLSEVFGDASPGKRLLGLVIGAQDESEADQDSKTRRYLIVLAPIIVLLCIRILISANASHLRSFLIFSLLFSVVSSFLRLYLILLFCGTFSAFRRDKLCLHDKLSRTAVYVKAHWTPRTSSTEESVRRDKGFSLEEPPPRNPDAVNKLLFKSRNYSASFEPIPVAKSINDEEIPLRGLFGGEDK
ncbi:RDD family protein [bacterium]|nr:RDD family protein [bacterium]